MPVLRPTDTYTSRAIEDARAAACRFIELHWGGEHDEEAIGQLVCLLLEARAKGRAEQLAAVKLVLDQCGERFALLAGGEAVCTLPRGHVTKDGDPSAHAALVKP